MPPLSLKLQRDEESVGVFHVTRRRNKRLFLFWFARDRMGRSSLLMCLAGDRNDLTVSGTGLSKPLGSGKARRISKFIGVSYRACANLGPLYWTDETFRNVPLQHRRGTSSFLGTGSTPGRL